MAPRQSHSTGVFALCGPLLFCVAWTTNGSSQAIERVVEIRVYPSIQRSISGVTELDRSRYFAMCDPGSRFDQRMASAAITEHLLGDLNATFGRRLSPISAATGGADAIREDARRPGYADLERLRATCAIRRRTSTERFRSRFPNGLEVAAHGLSREYPSFLGEYTTPQARIDDGKQKHQLPANLDGAAELAAVALKEGYGAFDRPAYFEPINEPHWSFVSEQHLADWHVKAHRAVHKRGLPVRVGGPCLPVAYFYRDDYRAFRGFKKFLANTNARLDFYSFHVYDYMNWDGEDLTGRITSGLPIEGVLDLVQSHAVHQHGGEIDLVVSEHGGYISGSRGSLSAEEVGELLAPDRVDGEDEFGHVLRQRSVASHVLVSAAIANTLVFVEHPHVLRKAIPFILPETMGWDPRYYSTMYVPHGFADRTRWVETRNTDFYKFFRDLRGARVHLQNADPDIQARAFVDGEVLRVVMNNLSDAPHTVRLRAPRGRSALIRRYGRNSDYTPYLRESEHDASEPIALAGREAVVVSVRYEQAVPVHRVVDERPCYGRPVATAATSGLPRRFEVRAPDPGSITYATLRVAVTRPSGEEPDVLVRLNGKRHHAPMEEAAARLDDGQREYASTKLLAIDPSLLRVNNWVDVTFPNDGPGAVGSVVLRVGRTLGGATDEGPNAVAAKSRQSESY